MRVREIMKTKVYTVAPSESVVTAVNRFRTNQIHHLIVARGSKVLGLVTDRDVDRAVERGAESTPVADVMTSEVVTIDPNSPAEQAGLKPRGNTAIGAVAETASAFLGPLQMLTNPLVEKATEGERGDLIVAVDDHRVRSRADLDDEMAKLKPGDTLYLTVIRPTAGGHKTMKIAVKVGQAGEIAEAAPGAGGEPAAQPTY